MSADKNAPTDCIVNGIKNNVPDGKTYREDTGPMDVQHTEYIFLRDAVNLIVKVLKSRTDSGSKVVEFRHPGDLEKEIDLQIDKHGTKDHDLLSLCDVIVKYSVKTCHPYFFNQLWSGVNEYSLAGSWVTDALNTSQYTFEVAPVFTVMERVLFNKMLGLVGFDDGEAIFCPGGSMSNMYALNVARYKLFPTVKKSGVQALHAHLCALTSEKAHYSFKKGMSLLGLGTDNLLFVKCDAKGKMIPEELEREIKEAKNLGQTPFIVCITAGTTVEGAYDPISPIADICEKYGLWLHVDGALGASVILSRKYRSLMDGSERADSLSWNPHKMMGVPLQAAVFLTRHKGILEDCNGEQAKYLFQQDKFYDTSYDTGDMSLQCGRKVDVLKLWLQWKAKGDTGYDREISHVFDCARYLSERIKATIGFRLLYEPESCNVCFWYIPFGMRDEDETEEWWKKLSKVAPTIKRRMMEEGTMMIGYQPDSQHVNFFRMVVSNAESTPDHMDFVIREIERLGKDL